MEENSTGTEISGHPRTRSDFIQFVPLKTQLQSAKKPVNRILLVSASPPNYLSRMQAKRSLFCALVLFLIVAVGFNTVAVASSSGKHHNNSESADVHGVSEELKSHTHAHVETVAHQFASGHDHGSCSTYACGALIPENSKPTQLRDLLVSALNSRGQSLHLMELDGGLEKPPRA